MTYLQSRVWFWVSLIVLLGFVDFSNHSVTYAEVAKEPPPIHPEAVLPICPGMQVSEVVRLIGPPRMDDCKEAIPLYPPCVTLILTKGGPRESDLHWVTGPIAVTVRVNNRTKQVIQVWHNLKK